MTDRFFAQRGEMIRAQCSLCKHRRRRAACSAFPDGIPRAILTNEHDHREPYEGDNGIRFEPVDDEAAEIVAQMFEDDDVAK